MEQGSLISAFLHKLEIWNPRLPSPHQGFVLCIEVSNVQLEQPKTFDVARKDVTSSWKN